MKLDQLLQTGRTIRVLGVDDAHYPDKTHGSSVNIAAVICGGTRFEGMLWGSIAKDGMDATDRIVRLIRESKFAAQLHLVLLDGITFGGCNVVDLPAISRELNLPVVAFMRRPPNMETFRRVVHSLPNSEERWRRTKAAGQVQQLDGWVFQCAGEKPEVLARVLSRLTDNGKVPEVLRLAHLIGSAVMLGESTNRA
jgi:endonuclease V-like protein UPF0215 family